MDNSVALYTRYSLGQAHSRCDLEYTWCPPSSQFFYES
ncbi:hypothetical protein FOCG_07609 [Fusarium oxysporum f. sp. radicis-lycopersici 26381]|uniref:Uncharacterized protein n=1 Tax=Fusarium oxysporum f. sp. narcissi TaxID=451672 RepID=A0A4Q2W3S9_FUSOX|nr:hypothetical protein FOWG_11838 [Fusarium oxysporum f. sp. lycopersici MN25]EXL51786.1 hypothetical protein FOCG_07609 [Fusarium oxysporum f. sp. radicis-lycopersici 26381]RYC93781.1 hypothetical protein BFJ63_vAg3419 [Fusarium oxysporum f. sp. narcissi]